MAKWDPSKVYIRVRFSLDAPFGEIAQLVEQRPEESRVGGSIPSFVTNLHSRIAQLVEPWTVNPLVAGSSPAPGANKITAGFE